MSKVFDQIQDRIIASESILLVGHENPDGDACGAVLAMFEYLTILGKKVSAFTPTPAPSYFSFLPNFESLTADKNTIAKNYDAVIFLDCSSFDRGKINREELAGAVIINIDHHWTNTVYGDLNLIQEKASSTCEAVYNFFSSISYEINRDISICLLNGILSDTSGFSNAATTSEAMAIAGKLIRSGAKINKINEKVEKNKSLLGLRLWGKVLSRLTLNKKYNLAYTYVTIEEVRQENVSEEEIDGLVNFLNVLSDAQVVMVLKIGPISTKGSFRTKSDKINVADLAGLFGGGGHKKAAGFTVPWTIIEKDGRLVII